jgi:hypothetical protein
MTGWSEAFVKALPRGTSMSAADDQTMQAIESAVHACMQSLKAGQN